jgi:DNA polymerase
MSRIFINYRRQDTEGYVGRLYDHLLKHFDHDDIFMDVDSIQPGVDFMQALEDAVSACDVFIAMIGPQWLTATDETGERRLDQWNDFVRLEIASALKQAKMVIPVLVGKARMPAPSLLPEDLASLSRRNAIELSHERFGYDIERLVEAIRSGISAGFSLKPRADAAILRQKEIALKTLRLDLVNATASPLYDFRAKTRSFPVLGEGNPDASIMLIGEAPGKTEAEQGRPFCGPSGEVLTEMLRGIGLRREDVFTTNLLLDRPPEKRDPLPEEIEFYTPIVDKILEIIQPAAIVPLGRFATGYILKKYDLPEKRSKISDIHGMLLKAQAPYGEIYIMPLYHPAVVLYSASQKETLRKDFEKLRLFI